MSAPSHFQRYTPRVLASWPEGTRHQSVDGTMVFCDISGFTALSERLAKKGRVGSEEVAAALTKVFSEMLDIAIGRGGDLLKFGGDALLLIFTGAGHCARAAASAFEMKQRLKVVGRIETGSGRVILDMTVGVNTGRFDLFVVGDRHGELVVAGADASGTVRAEESSDKGQITVTPAVAALIDSGAVAVDGDRFLLVAAPTAPSAPDPAPRTNDRLDLHVPTALRPVVGTPASDGEHRRAVIAFLKFKGTDEGIVRRGPEEVWCDLDATVRIIQAATDEFGVTFLASDIDVDGGKIILIAGTPTTTDNDTERLLRALRRIEESNPPLPLKIGVNTGTLFAGDVGSSARAAYTVIGDPVNLAARLMGKAEPGQILAENLVLERSDTLFETTPVEPFFVKGKTAAVEAVVVGPVSGIRVEHAQDEVPMLGRADVLVDLFAQFAEVSAAGARLVDLVGPAGIGKTRLLAAARFVPQDEEWIQIDCERYEASTSYYALRILIRSLLGVDRDANAQSVGTALHHATEDASPTLLPWLPLVANAIGAEAESTPEAEALADAFRRDRTHDTMLRLVQALTPDPVAIVFDNAQWIDDNSRDVILRAQTFADALPWLICLSGQATGQDRADSSMQIELGPLSDEDCLELARIVSADQPLPHHRLLEAVERSGGNPIFLISLVESAMAGDELPANVEDLINARIDALGQEERKVLRCAAVIGSRFRIELLETVIEDSATDVRDPKLWRQLDEYVAEMPNGDMAFRQNLYRDVAYLGLPHHLRRNLHLRIGTALEATVGADSPELLALHFALAEDHERAWKYSSAAGDRAAANFNHVDAADLYRRAVEASRRLDTVPAREVARIYEALGTASESAGLFDVANEAYATARSKVPDDPIVSGRLLRRQGLLRELGGNYSVALRWLTRGLKTLGAAAPGPAATEETARLQLAYAGVRYRQGQYDQAIERSRAVVELPGVAAEQEAHAHYLLCLALAHLGDPSSEDEGKRALAFYDATGNQLGRANVLNNLGMNAYYRGNWDESIDYWSQSGEAREACGDIVGAATQTNNLGEIYSDQGKWNEARSSFTEALRIWQGARYGVGIALASSNLGRVEARSLNHSAADEWLTKAVDGFEAIGAAAFALEARIRAVENLVLAHDDGAESAALALVGPAAGTPGATIPESILQRILGRTRRQRGDIEGAEQALETSLALAVRADAPFQQAQTLSELAQLRGDGTDPDADAIFERLGVVGSVDRPWSGLAGQSMPSR